MVEAMVEAMVEGMVEVGTVSTMLAHPQRVIPEGGARLDGGDSVEGGDCGQPHRAEEKTLGGEVEAAHDAERTVANLRPRVGCES